MPLANSGGRGKDFSGNREEIRNKYRNERTGWMTCRGDYDIR